MTIGLDLGDKSTRCCALDQSGEMVFERSVATTKKGMGQTFGALQRCRIALEVGTHSPWVSRLLKTLGHEVIVANARQVKLISQSTRKDDKLDAQTLARLARIDPELLRPIRHRSEQAQLDLTQIRVRATLVEARTSLVNAARGLAKPMGERLPKCDAGNLTVERLESLPAPLAAVLKPLLEEVESLTEKIHACDEQIEQIARTKYPETELLRQVSGVGPLIALTFVLTVEDPARFANSREAGCYAGLRPKRRDSGERQPELGITKEGDVYLRKLLVQGAHCILSQRAPDTDLKRWGSRLAARGGKNAKKRALVAVARKLAVLLHRLWVTGAGYEPLRNSQAALQLNRKAA
ncbi:MAG: IS110 family transposase [Acidobacteriaceae bacterium]|nr:IS110 family transposase [Acidobacteriaceae bacterium]